MHTDLSIPALHLQLFPFLQPVVDAVKNAPCNLTLIAPASANVLRAFKMAYEHYCASDSEWADTDACTNTRKIIELDQVAVDNARKLADMNMQGQWAEQGGQMCACRQSPAADASQGGVSSWICVRWQSAALTSLLIVRRSPPSSLLSP